MRGCLWGWWVVWVTLSVTDGCQPSPVGSGFQLARAQGMWPGHLRQTPLLAGIHLFNLEPKTRFILSNPHDPHRAQLEGAVLACAVVMEFASRARECCA